VSDVFAETCKLSWKPPADDGGGAIAGEWNESLRHQLPKFYSILFVCRYCHWRHWLGKRYNVCQNKMAQIQI